MSDIDTAAIRVRHGDVERCTCSRCEDVYALCDALDAARAEVVEIRERATAEMGQWHRDYDAARERAEKAEAAVARVRALAVHPNGGTWPSLATREVLAALDGPGGPDTWEWLGADR